MVRGLSYNQRPLPHPQRLSSWHYCSCPWIIDKAWNGLSPGIAELEGGQRRTGRPPPAPGPRSLLNVTRLHWSPLHCPPRSRLYFWACITSENNQRQSYHEFNTISFRLLKNLWRLYIFFIKIQISQNCICRKQNPMWSHPEAFISVMLSSECVFYLSPRVRIRVRGVLFIQATMFEGGVLKTPWNTSYIAWGLLKLWLRTEALGLCFGTEVFFVFQLTPVNSC